MKTYFTLLFFAIAFVSYGQGVSVEPAEMAGEVEKCGILPFAFDVIHEEDTDKLFLWRIERGDAPEAWSFQVCDYQTCYGYGLEECPVDRVNVLEPNTNYVFEFKAKPNWISGSATVNLVFYNPEDSTDVYNVIPFNINSVQCTATSTKELEEERFNIFPNPTSDIFTIDSNKNFSKVELYNVVGKRMDSFNAENNNDSYDISSLQNGLYLVKLLDNNGETLTVLKLNKN